MAQQTLTGTVLRAQSGFFWVQTAQGVLTCRLRGRLKKERQNSNIAVIGDEVDVLPTAPGEGAVEAVHTRRTRFSRQQPGRHSQWREDVLIANLDQVVIVFACAQPAFNPRMLDRFLVVAEYNEVPPLIVANKTDLVTEEAAVSMFAPYRAIGYEVLYVSAATGQGINELRERLANRISVFTGRSGVGKSSLMNALAPELQLETSAVSEALNKGRHTTVVAQLVTLAGGYVADTPGIRELAAWQIPDEDLAWCFPEFRPYLGTCDFSDCTHIHEPGCGVLAALAEGVISPARHDSYVRQYEKKER